jgi:hypothetical protein
MLIEIKHSPGRGRGVFARTAIPKDTVIECAATLPLTPHEQELIAHTQVDDYLFARGATRATHSAIRRWCWGCSAWPITARHQTPHRAAWFPPNRWSG